VLEDDGGRGGRSVVVIVELAIEVGGGGSGDGC